MTAMPLEAEQARLFDELYRKHRDEVFRVCLKFGAGDRAWALDRMHDVFVTLAEKLPKLRDPEDLGGWLYRTSVNCCFSILRKQRGWRRVFQVLQTPAAGRARLVEPDIQARRDLAALEGRLRHLPPNERTVMTLVYVDNKSQAEAAELLDLSRGYISKVHDRALALLKEQEWELAYEP
jgi:RNA polymerase sigma factor (sigma-70 family)